VARTTSARKISEYLVASLTEDHGIECEAGRRTDGGVFELSFRDSLDMDSALDVIEAYQLPPILCDTITGAESISDTHILVYLTA
jgi:hypothetical protein